MRFPYLSNRGSFASPEPLAPDGAAPASDFDDRRGVGAYAQTGAHPLPSSRGSSVLREALTPEGAVNTQSHGRIYIDVLNEGGDAGKGAYAQTDVSPLLPNPVGESFILDGAATVGTNDDTNDDMEDGGSDNPSAVMNIDRDHDPAQDGSSSGPEKRKMHYSADTSDEDYDDSRPQHNEDFLDSKKRKRLQEMNSSDEEHDGNPEHEDSLGLEKRKTYHHVDSMDVDSEHDDSRTSRGMKKVKYRVNAFKLTSKARKNRQRNPRRPAEARTSPLKRHQNLRDEEEDGDSIWRPIYISVCISMPLAQVMLISNTVHRMMPRLLTSM